MIGITFSFKLRFSFLPERPFKFLTFILALSNVQRHQELFKIKKAISIRIKYSKDVATEAFSISTWEHFLEEV